VPTSTPPRFLEEAGECIQQEEDREWKWFCYLYFNGGDYERKGLNRRLWVHAFLHKCCHQGEFHNLLHVSTDVQVNLQQFMV